MNNVERMLISYRYFPTMKISHFMLGSELVA